MNEQKTEILSPAFPDNNIPVIFSTDDKYYLFLSVVLHSLKVHSADTRNYDIIILEEHLNYNHKETLLSVIKEKKNFSIRFINMTKYLTELGEDLFQEKMHWTRATYYRLCLPKILTGYEKIIYLDVDLIILTDIGDLFSIDIHDFLIGCILDPLVLSRTYLKYLKTEHLFAQPYFNAGVLLINFKKFCKYNIMAKCLEILQSHSNFKSVDQDVLNIACQGKIKLLDMGWNYSNYWLPEFSKSHTPYSTSFRDAYSSHESYAKILHCIIKPWARPDSKFADLWWAYAEELPFIDQIRKTAIPYMKREFQNQQKKYDALINSTTWKLTLPLRTFFNIIKSIKSKRLK